ncbi:MAG: HAD family phosphatase [Verrucomicrobiales bacterium]|nr:HAD family phosphatase [Verrucomicrobiales bacterium]
MKPYTAVIFDMDGVIVDSEPLHERAFLDTFARIGNADDHGIHFPDYYGRSDQVVWRDFLSAHQPPQSLAELSRMKQERFLELLRVEQPVFPAIPALVRALASRGPVALASGSNHAVISAVLDLSDLRRQFSAVVSADDVPRGKPAPDIFLRAAELLEVPPTECVVIEDSVAGVAAGRAAGMKVIGITNSVPAEQLREAHVTVADYSAIQNLLV